MSDKHETDVGLVAVALAADSGEPRVGSFEWKIAEVAVRALEEAGRLGELEIPEERLHRAINARLRWWFGMNRTASSSLPAELTRAVIRVLKDGTK